MAAKHSIFSLYSMATYGLQYTKHVIFLLACLLVISLITLPVYGQQFSTQRLKLWICAYSKEPVGQFTVKATYKGESLKKTQYFRPIACHGGSGMWVQFLFSPKVRGYVDLYSFCVYNLSTQERNCGTNYWFPGTSYSVNHMQIFSNR